MNRYFLGIIWKVKLTEAIQESNYFLFLLSNASVSKRGLIQKELKIASDIQSKLPPYRRFIIPAHIEECYFDYNNELLSNLQYVDLFRSYERGINQIVSVFL